MCSLVAETGSSSFPFCFEVSCLRKQNRGGLLLCSLATLPRRLLRRRSGVLFLFHFASSLFVFHFAFGAFLFIFITCFHYSQTSYTPSSGHKHVKQYTRTTLANKKSAIRARGNSFSVIIHVSLEHRGRAFQVQARFLGSTLIRARVNAVSVSVLWLRHAEMSDLVEATSYCLSGKKTLRLCTYPTHIRLL